MNWILKLFVKRLYKPEAIDEEKMKNWLWRSFKDDGFKSYYTMRKRQLVNFLILEDNITKRAEAKGRLEELRSLSANIRSEYNRRKNIDK